MTARFVPLSVAGVSVNVIMAMLVAYVVSTVHGRDCLTRQTRCTNMTLFSAWTDHPARRNSRFSIFSTLNGHQRPD